MKEVTKFEAEDGSIHNSRELCEKYEIDKKNRIISNAIKEHIEYSLKKDWSPYKRHFREDFEREYMAWSSVHPKNPLIETILKASEELINLCKEVIEMKKDLK